MGSVNSNDIQLASLQAWDQYSNIVYPQCRWPYVGRNKKKTEVDNLAAENNVVNALDMLLVKFKIQTNQLKSALDSLIFILGSFIEQE